MGKLQSKVVWVTGASSGIGEALVYALAKQGCKLILSARRKEELERVKGNCLASVQPNVQILPLDLSKSETLHASTQAAIQFFGHVDVLVNNGGISQRSLVKDTVLEVDRELMEVDYFGTVAVSKFLLPHFLERKSGHYVVTSSVMGIIGTPYRSGYAAAKHALHGFFDSLRAEVWRENIFVTMICPGWIRTNITLNALVGDGAKLNEMDTTTDKGLSPSYCAQQIVKAIETKKEEVYIGGAKEVLGVYLKRYFPKIFSSIVKKVAVR
ncbi:MAG: SDR family oxidoreductase [Flammeovirgaceae bacterium]